MFLDLHCDTMLKIQNRFEDYRFSLKEADAQGGGLQIFACWLDVAEEEHPFHKAVAIIENFKRAVAQDSRIVLVRRYSEIPPVLSLGKTAALLSIEDCGILEGSLENLHTLYQICLLYTSSPPGSREPANPIHPASPSESSDRRRFCNSQH